MPTGVSPNGARSSAWCRADGQVFARSREPTPSRRNAAPHPLPLKGSGLQLPFVGKVPPQIHRKANRDHWHPRRRFLPAISASPRRPTPRQASSPTPHSAPPPTPEPARDARPARPRTGHQQPVPGPPPGTLLLRLWQRRLLRRLRPRRLRRKQLTRSWPEERLPWRRRLGLSGVALGAVSRGRLLRTAGQDLPVVTSEAQGSGEVAAAAGGPVLTPVGYQDHRAEGGDLAGQRLSAYGLKWLWQDFRSRSSSL